MKHYPTKFDVSKCLSADRTFPACKSSVKAPVELESHLTLIRNQIIPPSGRNNKTIVAKKAAADIANLS